MSGAPGQHLLAALLDSWDRNNAIMLNLLRDMDLHYDHPILLLQLLLWHEGYHHGQIKVALKVAGYPISDDEAGPLTWDVWRRKKGAV